MSDEKEPVSPQPYRRRKGGPKKGRRKPRGEGRGLGGEGTLQRSHREDSSMGVSDQEQTKSSVQ